MNILVECNNHTLCDNIMQIKYNVEIGNSDILFFRKSKEISTYILNNIEYKINKMGYHYVDMTNALNYLLLYCIMDNNRSLNDFENIFIQEIKNITIKNIINK